MEPPSADKEMLSPLDDDSRSSLKPSEHGNESSPGVGMENVLKALGVPGRYQVVQIILACTSLTPFSFAVLSFVFIGYEPPHTCRAINNTDHWLVTHMEMDNSTTVRYGYCQTTVASNRSGQEEVVACLGCVNGFNYGNDKYLSMVTEWDLFCDQQSITRLVQSAFTMGAGLGSLFSTSVADRWGRKYVFIACTIGIASCEIGLSFATSIYVAIAIKFMCGVLSGGLYLIHFVVSSELIISKYRQIYGAIDCIIWALNLIVLSGLGYFLNHRGWRYFQLISGLFGVPALISSFLLNETPAWCFAKGRYEDVQKILKKACKMNGKDFMQVQKLFMRNVNHVKCQQQTEESFQSSAKSASYSPLDILRHKYLILTVAIASFCWFSATLCYYGLYLTSSTIAGNRFLNFFLMSALEIPSCLVYMVALIYFGRRSVLLMFFVLSALCLLVSTCLVALKIDSSHAAHASTAFFLLGKFAIGSCFNVIVAYTPELFPTTMRSSGMGICSFFGRMGGMVAPFLLSLFNLVSWGPGALLTSLCFISVCLLPYLQETRGRQLPTTIEETLAWRKGSVKDET